MTQDLYPFPSREEEVQAWEELARKIASTQKSIRQELQTPPSSPKGQLFVIGSGIQALDFIQRDEELIRKADAVFYCVADPCTIIWIKTLRPDAYNLYVLYGNHKVRHITYTQMSEAILYYVRQGKKVVAIFYGHPGIFAFSPHRSVLIAKKEGHEAVMRPGISALDCLCADLHIDPAHPGMQTHEATDLLVRKRRLDTTLHIVLWQVGLIGESGFRDRGYLNDRFPLFAKYLQEAYGEEHPVTHYIASRYATVPPTIETYKISEIFRPEIQRRFTGISTFYLSPKEPSYIDAEMAEKLGFISKGSSPIFQPDPLLRVMDRYGPKEMAAFDDLQTFRVPPYYHHQKNTAAGRFLIDLQKNPDLQGRFKHSPDSVLNQREELTDRDKKFIKENTSSSLQIVAKGFSKKDTEGERLIRNLFSSMRLSYSLIDTINKAPSKQMREALDAWARERSYRIDRELITKTWTRLAENHLSFWEGMYLTQDVEHLENHALLVISSKGTSPQRPSIYLFRGLLKEECQNFSYKNGFVQFHLDQVSAFLKTDKNEKGKRRLLGHICSGGRMNPKSDQPEKIFKEVELLGTNLNLIPGMYQYSDVNGFFGVKTLTIVPPTPEKDFRTYQIQYDQDAPIEEEVYYLHSPRRLKIQGREYLLEKSLSQQEHWEPMEQLAPWFYRSYLFKTRAKIPYSNSMLTIQKTVEFSLSDGTRRTAEITKQNHKQIQIKTSDISSDLSFLIDPITLLPYLHGTICYQGEIHPCYGVAPYSQIATPGKAAHEPLYQIPENLWASLVQTQQDKSNRGQGFLFLQYQRSRLAHLALQTITKTL